MASSLPTDVGDLILVSSSLDSAPALGPAFLKISLKASPRSFLGSRSTSSNVSNMLSLVRTRKLTCCHWAVLNSSSSNDMRCADVRAELGGDAMNGLNSIIYLSGICG